MIALLVMTDGRAYVHDTIRSAEENLVGATISERWIHDDSGRPEHTARLRAAFPEYRVVATPGRSGFGGAIRSAWNMLRTDSTAPYVFHLEDDFTFVRPVQLADMIGVLQLAPELLQLALRRQPWNDQERAAGGIVEQHPDAYTECEHVITDDGCTEAKWSASWLEHRLFFTTNPSIYHRELYRWNDWPTGANSEGRFSHQLLNRYGPRARFGFFGSRASGEWVHHIGAERVGTGY